MPSPLNPVVINWAALVALGALPYLKLRHALGLESPEALQWSLVAVSVAGTVAVLRAAWNCKPRARLAFRARPFGVPPELN